MTAPVAPVAPSVPVQAPAAPIWRDTQAGRAEEYVRRKLRQMLAHIAACQPPDYDEAVEFMGAEKAVKMMHNQEVEDHV